MNSAPDDSALAALATDGRRRAGAPAPPFDRVWSAAEAEHRSHRRHRFLLAAAALAVSGIVLQLAPRQHPDLDESLAGIAAACPPADPTSLGYWQPESDTWFPAPPSLDIF